MFKLRDYQLEAKSGIINAFRSGDRRVILGMPTGAGKTVTFVDMLAGTVTNNKVAMIVCDRKELIGQALKKVQELGLNPTVIAPGYKMLPNNVYLASVDTLRRRDLPYIDLLIIDEAHKQSFDSTIHRYIEFCDPYIIGATATPLRTGNQNCLSTIYDVIIEPITISALIEKGSLVDAKTYAAKENFDDIKTRGGDYATDELFSKFDQTKLYDGVIDNYKAFSMDEKAICFNVNVEHSLKMTEKFKENGISCAHIDGNTPKSLRESILRDFTNGKFLVLSNCSVLTTGYDEPSIKTVIVNRATKSLPLWLQMTGRGSRPFEGKPHFKIIDQGANVYRHGLWQQEREWSLVKKKKKDGDGVAPVKVCPKCMEINYTSARVCKSCGEVFPVEKKELKKAEFVEVKVSPKRGSYTKPDSKTASRSELIEYGQKMGYKNPSGWAHNQLKFNGRL